MDRLERVESLRRVAVRAPTAAAVEVALGYLSILELAVRAVEEHDARIREARLVVNEQLRSLDTLLDSLERHAIENLAGGASN